VSVTAITTPEAEEYVDRKQLAKLMGISVQSVDRLVADGMPSETWGMRSRRFKPSVSIRWARQRGLDTPEKLAA
jgi:phage terminase Nu1 subunit (DNA packaging protein)